MQYEQMPLGLMYSDHAKIYMSHHDLVPNRDPAVKEQFYTGRTVQEVPLNYKNSS